MEQLTEPAILYKYRSLEKRDGERVRDSLLNSTLYFASPAQFNDPFDCKIGLSLDGSEKEWKEHIGQLLTKHRPNLSPADRLTETNRILRSAKYKTLDPEISTRAAKTVRVYCLSAINDDILMWSHYANAHQGICLGFRAGPADFFFRRSQKIEYSPSYPKTRVFDSEEQRFTTAILTKSEHWSYEKEYRVIETKGPGVYEFPSELLVEVILGCQISDQDRQSVTTWVEARSPRPKLLLARKKEREFGLQIEEAL